MIAEVDVDLGLRTVRVREASLVKIQALWRGVLVRKQMQAIKTAYEEVFKELEGTDQLHVVWRKAGPCLPEVHHEAQNRQGISPTGALGSTLEQADSCHARDLSNSDQLTCGKNSQNVGADNSVQDDEKFTTKSVVSDLEECPKDGTSHMQESESEASQNLGPCHTDSADSKGQETSHRNESSEVNGSKHSNNSDKLTHINRTDKEDDSNNCDMTELKSQGSSSSDKLPPDVTVRHESTSIWEASEDSPVKPDDVINNSKVPPKAVLEEQRSHIAMELLWVQQAIASRKQYLRLRSQLTDNN